MGDLIRQSVCAPRFAAATDTGAPSAAMSPELIGMVDEARRIVANAVKRHKPRGVVALYSGGHDSLIATHIASAHPAFRGAASMDTTIGIPETLEYRREVAQSYQWRPREYVAPVSYRDIVLKEGFPGPGAHMWMYARLKERGLRALMNEIQHRDGDRVILVTGVRKSESVRRMGHVKEVKREGGKVFAAPILNWTDAHKDEYIAFYGLPRNPVSAKLCMSGECLCGAFAAPGEIAEIEEFFPAFAEQLHALEFEARKAGVHSVWGTRPPGDRRKPSKSGPMCASCDARHPATPEQFSKIMKEAMA